MESRGEKLSVMLLLRPVYIYMGRSNLIELWLPSKNTLAAKRKQEKRRGE